MQVLALIQTYHDLRNRKENTAKVDARAEDIRNVPECQELRNRSQLFEDTLGYDVCSVSCGTVQQVASVSRDLRPLLKLGSDITRGH